MNQEFLYETKNSLLTPTEIKYFDTVRGLLPEGYYAYPQVSLASIITRTDTARYQNELYRVIDICIINKFYKPIMLFEINDATHETSKRFERDKKIKMICEEAGIPLMRLWTKYGVNPTYIQQKINEGIEQSKSPVRIAHSKTQKPEVYQDTPSKKKKGCYIATAVYGSYDCQEVITLRKFRDQELSNHLLGRAFINIYYAISPVLVKVFGKNEWFVKSSRKWLDKWVRRLTDRD